MQLLTPPLKSWIVMHCRNQPLTSGKTNSTMSAAKVSYFQIDISLICAAFFGMPSNA
jgi:hypothetical protein